MSSSCKVGSVQVIFSAVLWVQALHNSLLPAEDVVSAPHSPRNSPSVHEAGPDAALCHSRTVLSVF